MYKIANTEQNNKTASEYETKSLLYLLGMRKDSDDISILFIDCFNDVTGGSEDIKKLWDVQSKGWQNLRPLTIGEALITLFLNHSSEIDFSYNILLIPKLNHGYLIDEDSKQFQIENFLDNHKDTIKKGLTKEYIRRHKLEQVSQVVNDGIDIFLSKILFVIADQTRDYYVKNIISYD